MSSDTNNRERAIKSLEKIKKECLKSANDLKKKLENCESEAEKEISSLEKNCIMAIDYAMHFIEKLPENSRETPEKIKNSYESPRSFSPSQLLESFRLKTENSLLNNKLKQISPARKSPARAPESPAENELIGRIKEENKELKEKCERYEKEISELGYKLAEADEVYKEQENAVERLMQNSFQVRVENSQLILDNRKFRNIIEELRIKNEFSNSESSKKTLSVVCEKSIGIISKMKNKIAKIENCGNIICYPVIKANKAKFSFGSLEELADRHHNSKNLEIETQRDIKIYGRSAKKFRPYLEIDFLSRFNIKAKPKIMSEDSINAISFQVKPKLALITKSIQIFPIKMKLNKPTNYTRSDLNHIHIFPLKIEVLQFSSQISRVETQKSNCLVIEKLMPRIKITPPKKWYQKEQATLTLDIKLKESSTHSLPIFPTIQKLHQYRPNLNISKSSIFIQIAKQNLSEFSNNGAIIPLKVKSYQLQNLPALSFNNGTKNKNVQLVFENINIFHTEEGIIEACRPKDTSDEEIEISSTLAYIKHPLSITTSFSFQAFPKPLKLFVTNLPRVFLRKTKPKFSFSHERELTLSPIPKLPLTKHLLLVTLNHFDVCQKAELLDIKSLYTMNIIKGKPTLSICQLKKFKYVPIKLLSSAGEEEFKTGSSSPGRSPRKQRSAANRKPAIEEFFALTLQSVIMNMKIDESIGPPKANSEELLKIAQESKIPFNFWHDWLTERMKIIYKQSKKKR
ncbi:unnamed protein product [Blepharisma stoltei]|uniref:Uncharacterized protein n=1 Tax=Blepharisma stoltei TaxID=1481888 RepID=A0AAU9K915_9CILI|nr:unnamed protein product [Blepharisma stoltei]